jgi:hypothetical protein
VGPGLMDRLPYFTETTDAEQFLDHEIGAGHRPGTGLKMRHALGQKLFEVFGTAKDQPRGNSAPAWVVGPAQRLLDVAGYLVKVGSCELLHGFRLVGAHAPQELIDLGVVAANILGDPLQFCAQARLLGCGGQWSLTEFSPDSHQSSKTADAIEPMGTMPPVRALPPNLSVYFTKQRTSEKRIRDSVKPCVLHQATNELRRYIRPSTRTGRKNPGRHGNQRGTAGMAE